MAFWLEKRHGDAAPEYIAEQITRLASAGDEDGVAMWRSVADRYDQLAEPNLPS